MKSKLFLLVFLSILLYLNSYSTESCPLIPFPQKSQRVQATFELTDRACIVYDLDLSEQSYYLQKELFRYEEIAVLMASAADKFFSTHTIQLKLLSPGKKDKEVINEEAFAIDMSAREVTISAYHKKGIFNGVVSFLQLVRLSEVKDKRVLVDCWKIEDVPQYAWRGVLLDESRHFFGKERVKELLDWMAVYKLNHFHWHLTDTPGWRIEIKQYPLLTYIGGLGNHTDPNVPAQYYTQEDIKEIVRYAAERHIEIIPEIDMPGHARSSNRAYPEYSGGGSKRYPEFTFNPGKENVYSYLTNILREINVLFPSQIIHLGGDEVDFGNENWNVDADVQDLMKRENLKNLREVEGYFVKRMSDSLAVLNNKVAAWDEVADYDLNIDNTIVYYWRSDMPEQLQKSIDKGFSVVLCPNLPFYLDYRQDSLLTVGHSEYFNTLEDVYSFAPNTLPVTYKADTKILGIQGNIWSEKISSKERLEYMAFPRIAALAECSWNGNGNKDFKLFEGRLKKHFSLYDEEDIYYFDPSDPGKVCEPKK